MRKKINTFMNTLRSEVCAILWTLFGLEILVILYLLTPPPLEPIVMIETNFATLSGDNILIEGGKPARYSITLNKNLDMDLNATIEYTGAAIDGLDFKGVKNVFIPQDEMQVSFELSALDDNIREGTEMFAVKIAKITGKTFLDDLKSNDQGGVVYTKLLDEKRPFKADKQSATLSLSCDKSLRENGKDAQCQLKLSQAAIEDTNMTFDFSGSALQGKDFTAKTSALIKKGSRSGRFNITPINDVLKEKNEKIIITLQENNESYFEDLRIVDGIQHIVLKDEAKPNKAITLNLSAPKKVVEGSDIKYKLTLSQEAVSPIEVTFKHSNNVDSFSPLQSVVIEQGQREKSFTVATLDNNIINNNSFITYAIDNVKQEGFERITLNQKSYTTKIVDEKKPHSTLAAELTIVSTSKVLYEDDDNIMLDIQLSQEAKKDLELYLDYRGTAIRGQDFNAPKKLHIKKGQKNTTLTLSPINNNIQEQAKNIIIQISKHSKAGLEMIKNSAKIELSSLDDKISSNSPQASLTLTGPKQISEPKRSQFYVLRLTQRAPEALDIFLKYSGDANSSDYIRIQKVTMPKGHTKRSFRIQTLDDKIIENPKYFNVAVSKIVGGGFENIAINDNTIRTKITDEVDIAHAFDEIIEKQVIEFDTGKSDITPTSKEPLNNIAQLLKKFPFAHLEIHGHTNSIGDKARNLKLSQERAETIKAYLNEQGIQEKRIKAIGFGDTKPLLQEQTPKAFKLNKRVEFKVRY